MNMLDWVRVNDTNLPREVERVKDKMKRIFGNYLDISPLAVNVRNIAKISGGTLIDFFISSEIKDIADLLLGEINEVVCAAFISSQGEIYLYLSAGSEGEYAYGIWKLEDDFILIEQGEDYEADWEESIKSHFLPFLLPNFVRGEEVIGEVEI